MPGGAFGTRSAATGAARCRVHCEAWMQDCRSTSRRGLKGLDIALLGGSYVATVSLGVLGMMGAMLSITGIFGMAAYSVSKRLRELGIRIALGAQAQRSVAGGAGTAIETAGDLARWRDCSWEFWRAGCWLSSCIRRLPAIRWYWRGCSGYGAAGAGGYVDSGAARLSVDPLILLREE
jgi:hypothetical protein